MNPVIQWFHLRKRMAPKKRKFNKTHLISEFRSTQQRSMFSVALRDEKGAKVCEKKRQKLGNQRRIISINKIRSPHHPRWLSGTGQVQWSQTKAVFRTNVKKINSNQISNQMPINPQYIICNEDQKERNLAILAGGLLHPTLSWKKLIDEAEAIAWCNNFLTLGLMF